MQLVLVLVSAFAAIAQTAAPEESKFSGSAVNNGLPTHYRVTVILHAGEELEALSGQLAATYGGRLEPFAEAGFTGFAVQLSETKARLLSHDPRVAVVEEMIEPSSPAIQPRVEMQERAASTGRAFKITTEAIPGFGTYTYDGSGNITSIGDGTAKDSFVYDKLGRLESAALRGEPCQALTPGQPCQSQRYSYDQYGNILQIVTATTNPSAPITQTFGVDELTNQIDKNGAGVNVQGTFDTRGNLTQYNGNTFEYDALNMITHAIINGSERVHIYSASDERVVTVGVSNGSIAGSDWTIRDAGGRVLRRYAQPGPNQAFTWVEDYIYRGGQLLAAAVPGSEKVRNFHVDHLGTPRLITGNGGAVFAEHHYRPLGVELGSSTTDYEKAKFTGHERDAVALDYMHARFYDPSMGRFLSVDPVLNVAQSKKSPQLWNRYSYALNNSLVYTDPTGETVYLITYSTGNGRADDELFRAALTRAAEIRQQKGYDSKKDTVLVKGVLTIGDFIAAVNLANSKAPQYGAVGIIAHFSHAGRVDGPQFHNARGDETYFNWKTLGKLKVNWAPGATALFFGCNTARSGFTKAFANAQGVSTYGFGRYSYFSSSPNERAAVQPTGPVYMIDAMGQENFFLPIIGGVIGRMGIDARPMVKADPDE